MVMKNKKIQPFFLIADQTFLKLRMLTVSLFVELLMFFPIMFCESPSAAKSSYSCAVVNGDLEAKCVHWSRTWIHFGMLSHDHQDNYVQYCCSREGQDWFLVQILIVFAAFVLIGMVMKFMNNNEIVPSSNQFTTDPFHSKTSHNTML